MTLTIDRTANGVGVTRLELEPESGRRVDTDMLRSINLAPLSEGAVMNAIHWSADGTFGLNPIALVLHELRAFIQPSETGRYKLPQGQAWEAVAAVVTAARMAGVGPQALLMEQLGIPRTVANYWASKVADDDMPRALTEALESLGHEAPTPSEVVKS